MSVPLIMYAVVSCGARRLVGGVGLGAAQPLMVATVTGVALVRSTRPASGSVPTLTVHRSTPQVGLTSEIVMVPAALRACASEALNGIDLEPVVALAGVVAKNEKTLSPIVTSPCVPSS